MSGFHQGLLIGIFTGINIGIIATFLIEYFLRKRAENKILDEYQKILTK